MPLKRVAPGVFVPAPTQQPTYSRTPPIFQRRGRPAPFGDASTVGVTISPWLIAAVAAVWLLPKLVESYSRGKRKE